MIPLRRAVPKHTRGTTQIASPSQAIPLIGLQQALSTDAADAGGFYSLSFSSLRLGSDSRTPAPWLAPSAISLGVQLAFDPLRLSLSFNLLESYHSFLKLSTKKCAAQRKMSSPDERPKEHVIANQCAHWCGNPPDLPGGPIGASLCPRDCHGGYAPSQ